MKMYSHFSKNREKIDFRFAQYGKGTFERTVFISKMKNYSKRLFDVLESQETNLVICRATAENA